MTTAWSGLSLTAVAASGNLTQLYPAFITAGVVKGSGGDVPGAQIRSPLQGVLEALEVEPDGTNGGKIELWDLNGADVGADVSSLAAVTNTQLTSLIALGKAVLLYEQIFTGTVGASLPSMIGIPFSKGLAARFSNTGPTGACKLTMSVRGGACKKDSAGA